ncbi:interleukin-1 receptor accessory protein isoform X2 [Amphiprion ocellaris]|uniref:interleukin-1 receptor accessory protein isoform X2 n=1 Tax=Amphiprion ocellaris TaxID=80972 RepID=UPI002410B8A1|nr:interleukin-1 receptor accessory protein isoform X2 [Amphiprion ocellaris]
MASFISTLLFLFLMGGASPAGGQSSELTEPMCYDWGESSEAGVSVLEGESGWLSCPLFSHPSVYNYTSTQSAGHTLFWYRLLQGQDLEEPITSSSRLSKDRERLWLQPATSDDTGQYICMLRNKSSCSKIAMRLTVLRPDQVVRGVDCEPPVAVAATSEYIGLQGGKRLDCPDLQDAAKMADGEPTVTWYHMCRQYPFWNNERQQNGASLRFYVMLDSYQGLYFCTVHYQRRGKTLNFTRSINVTAIYPPTVPKYPSILRPPKDLVSTVKPGSKVRLNCTGHFPIIRPDAVPEIWWTVDGKTLDKLADQRFSQTTRQVDYDRGDRFIENVLLIQDFQSEDLNKEFNCSVKNERGFETRRVQLREDVWLPSVELGCGLGVTLLLMLLLFVVYHVFWLELLLLYRSWFGTDERHTDDKEYDVYISYARNSEEEQFVLSTLRRVLENELGYSVCIFDRDSLPGGNLSDSILHSMQRSRRLLFVLSPDFLAEKSFSLLECRLGLYLQHGHQGSIVAVVFRSVSKLPCVEVAQLRQATVSSVTWRGVRSEPRWSRFWLRLRLALPVRPLALGRRLIDSTSSHSDLAAMALQRAQGIHNQRANQSRRNSRTSTNQSRRDRKAPPRGRGSMRRAGTCRGEGRQHSRRCSGCAGFMDQLEDRGVELTMEVSRDRTEIPEADPAPLPDVASDLETDSAVQAGHQDDAGDQQEIGSRTSEEMVMSSGKGEELVVTPPPTTNPN